LVSKRIFGKWSAAISNRVTRLRIFALYEIFEFGLFFENYRSSQKFRGYFSKIKAIFLQNNELGQILGDFFISVALISAHFRQSEDETRLLDVRQKQ
jgi:hypothetical protein